MHDPSSLREQARRCRVLSKTAVEPEVIEQLRVWAVELARKPSKRSGAQPRKKRASCQYSRSRRDRDSAGIPAPGHSRMRPTAKVLGLKARFRCRGCGAMGSWKPSVN
jgi:hypothetical protein